MKVNKYIVRASFHAVAVLVVASVIAAVVRLALDYINPTPQQMLVTIGLAFFAYCLYNMIIIQASILESKDKLNNKQ